MRCAALHRKLGTHISKVKSLSMDRWEDSQVDNMKKIGNEKSNAIWNAKRKSPPVAFDEDEVDSTMERYIRQKYEQRAFTADAQAPSRTGAGHAPLVPNRQTRSESLTSSLDDPPPPPPKPGRKFGLGLRSASSASFLSRLGRKEDKHNRSAEIGRAHV